MLMYEWSKIGSDRNKIIWRQLIMRVTDSDGKQYTIEPEANLSEADLTDIKYNDKTIWPYKFELRGN